LISLFVIISETDDGIRSLQDELRKREKELANERNLRKQIESKVEKSRRIVPEDPEKPYAYF
jgi:hypothetical protein